MNLRIAEKTICGALRFRFYDTVTLTFRYEEGFPEEPCVLAADIDLDISTPPCVLAEALPEGGVLTFEFQCNRQAFLDKIEKSSAVQQKGWAEIRVKNDMRLIAAGAANFEKSVFVEGFAIDPGLAEPVATTGYVDSKIETMKSELKPTLDAVHENVAEILSALTAAAATMEAQLDGNAQ